MAPRHVALLAAVAVVLFVNQLGFIYGLKLSSASTVALIFGSLPIFTGLFAALAGVERLSRRFVVAGLISFSGVALVAAGSGKGLSADVKGDLLALLGAATWGAYSVAIAPLMRRYSPYRISVVVISATALLLAAAGSRQLAAQDWPSDGLVWAGFAFAVIGPLVVTNVLWFRAIHGVGPSRASMFANLQPFFAAVIALVLLSESLSWLQLVGGSAIGCGIVVSRGRALAPQE
jgi:drug/metabolite transporter (DMT)-like permease